MTATARSDKVLRQARAMRTLADDPRTPPNEAEAARRQFSALLGRHGMSEAEVGGSDDAYSMELVERVAIRPPWASFVIAIMRKFFRVEVLECPEEDGLGFFLGYYLFGLQADVASGRGRWERLRDVYLRLWGDLCRDWQFDMLTGENVQFSEADQQAYFAGLTIGISSYLRGQRTPLPDSSGWGLVPVDEPEVEAEAESRFQPSQVTTQEIDLAQHQDMLGMGYRDGCGVVLLDSLVPGFLRTLRGEVANG